ncbi:hypothetical protein [Nostoc sp. 'Peltigera malacea cyanobiont' DB3992]|uniref:hypothetical protein n=1 Tax=Nostoc sp. 'Peltigera malacea cyanobiont' DB3992 TaxID=1206980 RepID=UPI00117CF917|nr:hypothetical protein [Nostoc sp. 'Peltigera malacea cyanobiont' DB3992]
MLPNSSGKIFLGLTHNLQNNVDAERLAAGYHSRRREASAPLRLRDLSLARLPLGEATGATRREVGAAASADLNFSQGETLRERWK